MAEEVDSSPSRSKLPVISQGQLGPGKANGLAW